MTLMQVLQLFGGLSLFLFGMNVMSKALEQRAGKQLKSILGKLTANPLKGFLLGFLVTAIIQSSSATTVMVVGFVNSGLMTLTQSVGIILGANLGAAATPLILSLAGVSGGTGASGFLSVLLTVVKPSFFTPILALVGIILYAFIKKGKKQNTGLILLGFAILMFGMEQMSASVADLAANESFTRLLTIFTNPIVGLLIGVVFTAVIQSSGASIGILQALSSTGAITNGMVIPILMGQNIGTCVSALISSIGASRNARRAAIIHLLFNVFSAVFGITLFLIVRTIFSEALSPFLDKSSSMIGIALINIGYKLISLLLIAPMSKLLVKLAERLIPEKPEHENENIEMLDERLLSAPAIAVQRASDVSATMIGVSFESLKMAMKLLDHYDLKTVEQIRQMEDEVDHYEDGLGSYLVKLSNVSNMSEADNREVTKLLHIIGDIERISDHAVDITITLSELHDQELSLSDAAQKELRVMIEALNAILNLSAQAFLYNDMDAAAKVEPLEQVVDYLKAEIKRRHINRLQNSQCTMAHGFILSDLLTHFERVSDHCSNIAGSVIEIAHDHLDLHEYLQHIKSGSPEFTRQYEEYLGQYSLGEENAPSSKKEA